MGMTVTLEDTEYDAGSAEDQKKELAALRLDAEDQTAALADVQTALRESEDRFLRLMRGAKDYALYMLDASGHVASWNAGAELLEGYRVEEVIGKHFSTFYQPCDHGRAQRNLATAEQTGRAEEEGWRLRKDGSTFWANVVLSSIQDPSGTLQGFAKIIHDLTERKNLEDQLNQARKMDAIGGLAAGVAHDFNNLLSVILSYSELLALGLKEGDPMRTDLEEIRSAGLLAVTLTRRLLAFGRQQVLQPKVVDLCKIVSGMESMLRRLVGEDVELISNFAPECGKVLFDLGQFEQVVMNLVVNARDAMPEGGKLTIDAVEVVLDAEYAADHVGVTAGPHVLFAVSDTGVGMDAATRARIFEPFFTTKDPGKGTGLGLATVFGIIKQSGGSIEVSSEPNHGTKVSIYLPMVDRATVVFPSVPPPNSLTLHGSETILLVEDDAQVRLLTRTILGRYGYNVLDAQSGGDALLLCEQYAGPIELLVTDVVMPRMSGRQLAERLLEVRPGMKVLYMSGYTDDAVVRHGIFYSKVAFIQKPITPEPLARKVREALDAPPSSSN